MDGDSAHGRRRSDSLLLGDNIATPGASSIQPAMPDESKIPSESDQSTDMELSSILSSDGEDLTDDEEAGLTETERKRRRRRRRRHNTELDNRIAGETLQAEEKGIAKVTLVRKLLINGSLIALWYTFSISISVYNKWMFSAENLDFHFPLFTTSLHMLVQFSLATAVLVFLPRFRPGRDGYKRPTDTNEHTYQRVGGDSDDLTAPEPKPNTALMTKSFYLTRISPCGTATALDIGLGNFSLRFISLTFFTMCKSSVLAFVLIFAFIFRLEKPTWKLCTVIALMTIGVILMVSGEAAFNALGFILVMTASFCSGFRWSLTQILLLRNPATSNPFSSIFFLTPVMFLALFLLALPIEGPAAVIAGVKTLSVEHNPFLAALILLFPGCLAFLMVAAEFALLQRTSVVTLSVCGIFKEVLTISAASLTFGDELSPINISGLIVTIASIAAYNWLKYYKMRQIAKREAHDFVQAEIEADGTPSKPRRGSQTGALADENHFDIGRDSADTNGGSLRNSLQMVTNIDSGGGTASAADRSSGMQDVDLHNLSKGPIRRPEVLE